METEKMEIVKSGTPAEDAGRIVKNHVWVSLGMGLLPLPLIDFLGITGIQLNMLRRLSNAYGIPFSRHMGKNVLASLVGGGFPPSLSLSLYKAIPVLGMAAGMLTMSVTAGASTYAIGRVFIQHFASGGTFLSFDPEKVRGYYMKMFKEGEQVAQEMKKARKKAKS